MIYCDSLSYNNDTEFFSMYGNIKIQNGSRFMTAKKATLDQISNQMTLLENCEINNEQNNRVYGDKILLDFKEKSLESLKVISNGMILSQNSGYEKIGDKRQLVENEDVLKGETIFANLSNDEIENIEMLGMASTLIHLYGDSLYDGINEVSGDRIILSIKNESLSKQLSGNKDYKEAMKSLIDLKDSIDAFFNNVMVNVDDEKVKRTRLALIRRVRLLFLSVADISYLSS